MADYFAEQEKAKVEARRAEKIRNYQNQISSLNPPGSPLLYGVG